MGRLDGVTIAPRACQGKRIRAEALLHADWLIQAGVRIVGPPGPSFVDLFDKHRECYNFRNGEFKCQKEGCYHTGILMESKCSKILECPAHLQQRLGARPAVTADDPLSQRSPRKKLTQEELVDQTRAVKVRTPPRMVEIQENGICQPRRSESSTSSQHIPPLGKVNTEEEDCRISPIPTPPVRETATWGGPNHPARSAPHSAREVKQADWGPTQHAPFPKEFGMPATA